MVDGVSFNPFTNKAFSEEEIAKLDTDKNGIVSQNELTAGVSWLSGSKESDEDGTIVDTSNLSDDAASVFSDAKKNGVPDKANSKEELKQFMSTVSDSYIENYVKKNSEMSSTEKSAIIAFIQIKAGEFLTKLTEGKTEQFDMKNVTGQFSEFIDSSINERKTKMTSIKNTIDGYKNNDGAFEKLANSAFEAAGDFVTDAEYQKLKNDAVKYLMGELLKGNTENDLLKTLNPNYQQNSNYKNALSLIKSIENETDPDKIKEAVDKAQTMITSLISSVGKDKFVEGITDTKQSKSEENLTEALTKLADSYIEAEIAANPGMSQEEIDSLTSLVKGCVSKYMSECAEKYPKIDSMDVTNLVQDFGTYVDSKRAKLVQTKSAINEMGGENTKVYNKLISTYDSASADKYISEDERASMIEAGTDFVINQILSGSTENALLKAVNANYSSSADYKAAINAINKMKSETDPDKLNELLDTAKKSINKLLTDCGKDKLAAGIKSLKPMEVSDTSKINVMNNSSISSDYLAGVTRNSSYGKQNDDSLKEIQENAKKDLEAVAESLRAQLKSELGDKYDSAAVERYIKDAMNDTMAQFTQNKSRRTRSNGNYNTNGDDFGFVFLRKKGTKSGRYAYNLKNLADTFISNFNKTSKDKNAARIDPSLATYDKENVIMDSLGNDYLTNKSEKIEGNKNDQNIYAQLIEKAKADLKSVAAALKASLIAEGVPLSVTDIDRIIDECINDTITDMKSAFQYCQPGGNVHGGGIAAAAGMGVAGGAVGAATAGVIAGTAAGYSALSGATAGLMTTVGATGSSALASTAGFAALCGPVGWVAAGVAAVAGVIMNFTNIFGATYGKHNADAGFYFERKSNSKDGKWGYDKGTLVDTFMAKIDAKIAEQKEKDKKKAETA